MLPDGHQSSTGIAISGAFVVAAAHPPAAKHKIAPSAGTARANREGWSACVSGLHKSQRLPVPKSTDHGAFMVGSGRNENLHLVCSQMKFAESCSSSTDIERK